MKYPPKSPIGLNSDQLFPLSVETELLNGYLPAKMNRRSTPSLSVSLYMVGHSSEVLKLSGTGSLSLHVSPASSLLFITS